MPKHTVRMSRKEFRKKRAKKLLKQLLRQGGGVQVIFTR